MRKEVIIAIILGFIVGLFIAYGIYTANKAVKEVSNPIEPIVKNGSSAPPPTASPAISLVIDEPEANLVFTDKTATVSGQTEPDTPVAVFAEGDEELLLSDKQGLFSTTVKLISGLNEIKVVVVDQTGNQLEKIIQVIQSTANIE